MLLLSHSFAFFYASTFIYIYYLLSLRFFQDNRSGQITLFYPQSGSQFVAEGFIIGFLNLMCGGALIFIAYAAPKFKSENNRSAAVIGSMIVFTICFTQIRGFYKMKNRWYGSI